MGGVSCLCYVSYHHPLTRLLTKSFDQFLMNIVIFIVYTTRVVPDIVKAFYSTVGDDPAVCSRMNSIRVLSWLQGDDDVFSKFGFKLERYMNTLYIAVVNLLMLCMFFFFFVL